MITLTELFNDLLQEKDIPENTKIIINNEELREDPSLSYYNNVFFKHIPSGGYLFVKYTDDTSDVRIYIILPNEDPKKHQYEHFLADDFSDNLCFYNKLDDNYTEQYSSQVFGFSEIFLKIIFSKVDFSLSISYP